MTNSPEERLTELRVTEAVVRVVVRSPPTDPDTKGTWQCPPTAEEEMGEDPHQAAEVAAVSGESGPRGTQASGRPRPPGLPPQVAVRASFDLHRLYDRLYRSSQLIDFRKTNKNTSVAMSCSDYSVLWRKDVVGRTWIPLKISPQPTETQTGGSDSTNSR